MENTIQTIQEYYGIIFPEAYLHALGGMLSSSYDLMEDGEVRDWEIRFHPLDAKFISTNRDLVDEVNPDPSRIIPIAWSVSSGNNYLLDYRNTPGSPTVLVMEHEEAMMREDAEDEAETPEQAQQMMEDNVKVLALSFTEFVARLRPSE
ncbi:SMI1/KNR4 family protein [Paenibacillus daejeonensis]|uniref:SMI1/KNR4 family protein n=1 Tax=Paenibacillus daejeonensis TaxID=135193 RepID=UPI00035D696D|nr:SMI1/KNR4 family protein [Paenibacillus daejeonensis]